MITMGEGQQTELQGEFRGAAYPADDVAGG